MRIFRNIGLVLSVLGLAPVSINAQLDEYQVKAAFVSNFANFVEWPAASFHNPQDPFSICVLGRNPFGHALESLAEGKSAGGRAFAIHEASEAAQTSGCQIVFISSSERLRFRALIESLRATNALTVGDTSDFIAEGGMIALRLEGGRIRMRINAQAAKEQNLRISARLLSLAENSR